MYLVFITKQFDQFKVFLLNGLFRLQLVVSGLLFLNWSKYVM